VIKERVRGVKSGWRRRLIIMVKEPVAGRVKTRLAREIGTVKATWFYRHVARTIIARMVADPRFDVVLAVAPDSALRAHVWPSGPARAWQGRGDLGERMDRLMRSVGPGPAIIVGTDIPAMRAGHVAEAFRLLRDNQAVFGAAGDGGYWLVGLKRSPCIIRIFENVRWSSPHALDDTRANLKGLPIGEATALRDVDDATDFVLQKRLAGRTILPTRMIRQSL